MDARQGGHMLVDGHVHFHECFDAAAFLEAALANLRRVAAERELADWSAALLLTESRGASFFRALRGGKVSANGWGVQETGEAESLRARGPSGELLIVAGRQIVTRERLEVLALGVDAEIPDGAPVSEIVERVRAAGGRPGIPWGFGKWWGARGRIVREALESAPPGGLFLGDNGGRLRGSPRPPLFSEAERRGVPVLPGSDPLPFPGQAGRAGSAGFHLGRAADPERPWAALRSAMDGLRSSPEPFGRLESLPRFCRYQAAMQLRLLRKG